MSAGTRLRELLGVETAPAALHIARPVPGAAPAPRAPVGCAFWPVATRGAVLRSTFEDHLACPIGAHTHATNTPAGREAELAGVVGTLVALQYFDPAEIPAIPCLAGPFRTLDYAPFDGQEETPDVVIVRGTARQIPLFAEAVLAAGGLASDGPMGRPACAAVQAVISSGRMVINLGCIGNRVYTGLGDGELYAFLPNVAAAGVVERLEAVAHANRELEALHCARAVG
jgi:uncharacterized protein (DUF169 family)